MKKIIQASILAIVALAIVLALSFTLGPMDQSAASGGFCARVGWNSRGGICISALPSAEILANGGAQKYVGWNG